MVQGTTALEAQVVSGRQTSQMIKKTVQDLLLAAAFRRNERGMEIESILSAPWPQRTLSRNTHSRMRKALNHAIFDRSILIAIPIAVDARPREPLASMHRA